MSSVDEGGQVPSRIGKCQSSLAIHRHSPWWGSNHTRCNCTMQFGICSRGPTYTVAQCSWSLMERQEKIAWCWPYWNHSFLSPSHICYVYVICCYEISLSEQLLRILIHHWAPFWLLQFHASVLSIIEYEEVPLAALQFQTFHVINK